MGNKKKILILCLGFAVAIGLVVYPLLSNVWNRYIDSKMIACYEKNVEELSEESYAQELARALAYNSLLVSGEANEYYSALTDDVYQEVLNLTEDGIMGYLTIPKINVSLPIYHGSDDRVLEKGIGHLQSTALPVGGTGTRCVLVGHRGLPGSALFTDLDQMEIGDLFYLTVLGEVFTYEVTAIEIVEPSDSESVLAADGEDLCTLLTCTPYGVNSHRLLVTGTRAERNTQEVLKEYGEESLQIQISAYEYVLLFCAGLEGIAFFLLLQRIRKRDTDDFGQKSGGKEKS